MLGLLSVIIIVILNINFYNIYIYFFSLFPCCLYYNGPGDNMVSYMVNLLPPPVFSTRELYTRLEQQI